MLNYLYIYWCVCVCEDDKHKGEWRLVTVGHDVVLPARSTVRSQGGGPFRCWVLCLMRLVDIDLSRLFIEYSYICNGYHDVMKYNGISPYCGFHEIYHDVMTKGNYYQQIYLLFITGS
jgi:hypothetical protein